MSLRRIREINMEIIKIEGMSMKYGQKFHFNQNNQLLFNDF